MTRRILSIILSAVFMLALSLQPASAIQLGDKLVPVVVSFNNFSLSAYQASTLLYTPPGTSTTPTFTYRATFCVAITTVGTGASQTLTLNIINNPSGIGATTTVMVNTLSALALANSCGTYSWTQAGNATTSYSTVSAGTVTTAPVYTLVMMIEQVQP